MSSPSTTRSISAATRVLGGVALLAMLGQSAWAESESVQDLRYGVTLYHFFQQQYFDALTESSAAQSMELLPHHEEDAELLRGGMSLSYGMDRTAREVFDSLLDKPNERVDADRAWFYLGKLAWRRGDEQLTTDALARMSPQYDGAVADEGHYIRALQALYKGDEQAANAALQRVQASCPFKAYYFYNLGGSRAQQGQWESAAHAFRQVEPLGCKDEEGKALRDKAFTAAGFSALAADQAAIAAEDFLKVSLHGPEADRALLGYGWSYANLGEFEKALTPWLELNSRSLVNASARESLLAVPFAYEQLQRPATALKLYEQAARHYSGAGADVEAAMQQLRNGDVLALFGLDAVVDPQWLGGEEPQPEGDYAQYLAYLLSTDQVQLAMRELRDLRDIQRRLALAQQRLGVLQQVDAAQQQTRNEIISGGGAERLAARRDALLKRSAQLRQQLDSALASGDGRPLADQDQLARWQRIENAETIARRLQKKSSENQLRLMRGLMQWQDSEDYPDRRWRLQRAMLELESLAAESHAAYAALSAATVEGARPIYAQRIEALARHTQNQSALVDATLDDAYSQLLAASLAELEQQHQQLAFSEGQALLAVARLYDLASPEVPR